MRHAPLTVAAQDCYNLLAHHDYPSHRTAPAGSQSGSKDEGQRLEGSLRFAGSFYLSPYGKENIVTKNSPLTPAAGIDH